MWNCDFEWDFEESIFYPISMANCEGKRYWGIEFEIKLFEWEYTVHKIDSFYELCLGPIYFCFVDSF